MKKNTLTYAMMLALASTSASALANQSLPRPVDEKPNVIVVFLDDAGYADIKVNGGKYPTPNIDKLANQGQLWKNFYVSSPISSPSRAGLLTARLGVRNGMYGNKVGVVMMGGDKDGLPQSEVTMAEMLQDNGYKTALLGKWHLGAQPHFYPTRHGFDSSYGILASNDMGWTEEYGTVEAMMGAYFRKDMETFKRIMSEHEEFNTRPEEEMWNNPVLDSFKNKDGSYTDRFSRMIQTTFTKDLTYRAQQYISENKDEPFFLYMAYPQNHVPLFVSPEFEGKTDSPYGDVMQEIDWSVGQIVQSLQANGVDKNTMIIFSSDNGPWDKDIFVEHNIAADDGGLAGGKNRTLEGGNKVPGIFYWPGKIKPAVIDGLGSTLDIMPTIAKLTGSELPSYTLDGIDLTSTLIKGDESPRDIFPYYMEGRFEAIRKGDWKLFLQQYGDNRAYGAKPKAGEYELYNLKNDPNEENNLASTHPEKVEELLKEAKDYETFVGEFAEPLFDPPSN